MKTYIQTLCLLSVLLSAQNLSARQPGSSELKQFTQSSNLAFIGNAGQITDQHYNPKKDIDFKLNAPGLDIFIGNGQLHYQWTKIVDSQSHPPPARGRDGEGSPIMQATVYRLDVTLVGANKNAKIIAEQKQDYYERYYLAHTPEEGVQAHSYKKITYQNIYPNIDWVLYIKDNQLKYDFVVHQGGKVKDIKLKYDGATDLFIKDGALTAITPFGSIAEQKPYSYEAISKKEVASAFVLKGNELSFDLGNFEGELIVDPQLVWATYYGGDVNDWGHDVATDAAQHIYMVGETESSNNIVTIGAHQTAFTAGGGDGFIVKFNPFGIRQWATYYGGPKQDFADGVACDANGMVYVAGTTGSLSGISTPGSYQSAHSWNHDAFLVKFDGNGVRQWATYLGDTASEWVRGITTDNIGNVYISGYSVGQGSFATPGAHKIAYSGNSDAFLAKFNSTGSLMWCTYYGGNDIEEGSRVVCDNSGNVYMCGITRSASGIATPGSYQSSLAGIGDLYIVKFNNGGVRQWGTYFGGPGDESLTFTVRDLGDIAYSPAGAIYITGATNSTSGITTSGANQTGYGGGTSDDFLAKFNLNGNLQWSTYYGGPGGEWDVNVTVSPSGLIYVGGTTNSAAAIATPNSHQPLIAGSHDIYIATFNSAGYRINATYFGAVAQEICFGITNDNTGNIYLTGSSVSSSGLATPGAHQTSNAGNLPYGAVLARWKEDTLVYFNDIVDSLLCLGQTLQVPYGVTYNFNPGNIFTVELSDISGSFANPTVIGTQVSAANGVINCIIPTNMTTGLGYKLRIRGSDPKDTSVNWATFRISDYPVVSAGSNAPVCANNLLNLTAASSISTAQYTWIGPNSFASGQQNPSVMITSTSQAGDYIVTANNFGCTAKDTINVVIGVANTAISSNSPLCIGATLNLTVSAVGQGLTYSWTGPNGFTSNLQNPSIANVTTAAGGIYTVTIGSPQCNTVLSTNVSVNVIPVVPTAGSNTPVCAGQSISLTANSTTPGVSYNWTGPGSYISNAQNPTRTNATVAMSGTYNVTASLGGCVSTAGSTTITVNPSPANVTAGSNSPLCAGSTINLTGNSSTSGITYSWTGPTGFTSNLQNPVRTGATVAMSGTYTVTAQLGTCSNTATANVVIGTLPATPTAASNTPVCSGQNINLTASSTTPGVTYSWTGPGAYSSTQQNPTRTNATVAMSGTYNVTATLNGCSAPPVSTNVIVTPVPLAPVATNNGPLCAGVALDLFATGQPGATYQWTGPGSYSSNNQNPTILNTSIANAGTYTVTQTVNGCTSPAGSTTVAINNAVNPTINIYPNPNDTVCPGTLVTFVAAQSNGGTAPQYQWFRNGNPISGANLNTHATTTYSNGDYYSCRLTSNAVCAMPATTMSSNITLTVVPPSPAVVNITATPGLVLSPWELVTFSATPIMGGVAPTYQWLRNGKQVIGAISNTWSANNLSSNDTISVVLFSSDPCAIPNTDTSNLLVVNIKTGISNIDGLSHLTLYPNPNNGDFRIEGELNAKTADIEVLNAIGQTVYTSKQIVNNKQLDHHIHLDLTSGIYLLRLSTGTGTENIRFHVQ